MKSVVNDTDGIVRVAESVIPEIKHQDEVRVKIASSGLCGSDLPRIFKNGAHYYPITLGHEFSGYIDAVGAKTFFRLTTIYSANPPSRREPIKSYFAHWE